MASPSSPPQHPRPKADKRGSRMPGILHRRARASRGQRHAATPGAAGSNNRSMRPHAIVARMKNRAVVVASLLLSFAGLRTAAAPAELKIATWNLEWFMTPETLRALTPACTPADAPRDGARRAVPCDVAHELARSREDIAALRRHARHARCGHRRAAGSRRPGGRAPGVPRLPVLFLRTRRGAEQWLRDSARPAVRLRARPRRSVDERRRAPRRRAADVSRHAAGTAAAVGAPEIGLRARSAGLRRGRIAACSRARCRCSSAGSMPRRTNKSPSPCSGISTAICGANRRGIASGRKSTMPTRPQPTLSTRLKGRLFKTACLRRLSAATSTTSSWAARWRRDWSQDSFGRALFRPKDALRRKLSDHCPVFIRLRVADAVRGDAGKSKDVKISSKPIKFSSVQTPISQGNNPCRRA